MRLYAGTSKQFIEDTSLNQIAEKLTLDWWTVQKHLRRLKRADLILSQKVGKREFYRVTHKCEAVLEVINVQNFNPSET